MQVLPTTSRGWLSVFLFPFKTYSVLGVVTFLTWDAIYHHYELHDWHLYGNVGRLFMMGYLLSGVILIIGGLIQMRAFKTTSSFFIGIADLFVYMVLPAFFPA